MEQDIAHETQSSHLFRCAQEASKKYLRVVHSLLVFSVPVCVRLCFELCSTKNFGSPKVSHLLVNSDLAYDL